MPSSQLLQCKKKAKNAAPVAPAGLYGCVYIYIYYLCRWVDRLAVWPFFGSMSGPQLASISGWGCFLPRSIGFLGACFPHVLFLVSTPNRPEPNPPLTIASRWGTEVTWLVGRHMLQRGGGRSTVISEPGVPCLRYRSMHCFAPFPPSPSRSASEVDVEVKPPPFGPRHQSKEGEVEVEVQLTPPALSFEAEAEDESHPPPPKKTNQPNSFSAHVLLCFCAT